jgi:methionyl-tRNA formyltransferase
MRIAILYNNDIYALKALNLLLPALTRHSVTLFFSSHVGSARSEECSSLKPLSALERALRDSVQQGETAPVLLGANALARRYGTTNLPLDNVNAPEGIAQLKAFAPDLMLSIRFGRILKAEAIAVPRMGVFNLHSGLLPAYRGVMPTFWSMLAGERQIGTTLHWIVDATIDTGPHIAETHLEVRTSESYFRHVWRLYDAGVSSIVDAVTAAEIGKLAPSSASVEDEAKEGGYFSFPDDAALAQFAARGLALYRPEDIPWVADSLGGVDLA